MKSLDYYQEITIIDQYDEPYFRILSQLYLQLHLAFVEQQDELGDVVFGISFPQYRNNSIGRKIRVFAPSLNDLKDLNLEYWLSKMKDCAHCTSIKLVPVHLIKNYQTFQKFHYKPLEVRISEQAKRRNISIEESREYFKDYDDKPMPYIHLKSLSLKINFKLYIKMMEHKQKYFGGFSVYGLSNKSTVPEF